MRKCKDDQNQTPVQETPPSVESVKPESESEVKAAQGIPNDSQKIHFGIPEPKPQVTEQTIRDLKLIDGEQASSVLSTAVAKLGLYTDPVVARNTAVSDFRIQDIMDNDSPVSLYLVLNLTNIQRLKPLVRLFISQLVFILMPEMEFKGGQMKAPYKHRLLLLLDKFPALGKLGIFEQAIAYFGGWNIKAYLICQDKAQLDAAYGKDESITSNCHVTIAYAPNKVDTAKKYLSEYCMEGRIYVVIDERG